MEFNSEFKGLILQTRFTLCSFLWRKVQ